MAGKAAHTRGPNRVSSRLTALRDSAHYAVNLSEGMAQLGGSVAIGLTPTRQWRKQISKVMRRIIGHRNVVVLHTGNAVMMDPGGLANEVKQHSRRVTHGGLHVWTAVND